jgi:hypothetical protein
LKSKRVFYLFGFSLALTTTFLSAEKIVRDFDRNVDFSVLKSYAWLEQKRIPIFRAVQEQVDPDLTDEKVDAFIKAKVDEQLSKKGFAKATGARADFWVSYLAVGKLDLSTSAYDAAPVGNVPYGHWRPFYEPQADTRLQRKGTFTLDLVDAGSNKLIWRGSSTDTFSKPKEARKQIEKAIKKLLKKFPPK